MAKDFITKSLDGTPLTEEEITSLFKVPLFSEERLASLRRISVIKTGLGRLFAQ